MLSSAKCLNCEAPLTGCYCSQCGQKTASTRPTVGHFFSETVESLTHADSRLWKTLWLLLSKPGFLTKEFFEGKRSRYLPPIRLYIVLSVAFFLSLAIIPSGDPASEGFSGIQMDSGCADIEYTGPFPDFMTQKLQEACSRLQQGDGARAFSDAFLMNLPKAMWVLLPVFALLMLVFWWKPRRLYAEHVLFLIHNHSAIFAALMIFSLAEWLVPEVVSGWLLLGLVIYLLWYSWRGMRVFYNDSRNLAIFKFVSLGFLYFFSVSMILVLTGITAVLMF